MAEYISKEMAINFLCRLNEDTRFVNDMPTIDIVHCSECVHYGRKPYETTTWTCEGQGDDGFCSSGERKE